jgi:hypothetical protein
MLGEGRDWEGVAGGGRSIEAAGSLWSTLERRLLLYTLFIVAQS